MEYPPDAIQVDSTHSHMQYEVATALESIFFLVLQALI